MQRRTFLKSATMAPLFGFSTPFREVRESLEIDNGVRVHIIATAHASAKAAERYRNQWIGEPFESEGEWYLQVSEARPLPDELATLPGSLSYHEYLFGEAAEELSMLVGAFRRDYIGYIIRVRDNNEDLLLALARWFARQPLPSPMNLAWSDTLLRALIPDSDDLGLDVETTKSFWP